MFNKTLLYIFLLLLLGISQSFSQDTILVPKREFRGTWLATVANIDWPSRPGLSTEAQKNELINILNNHQKSGINAIMMQIRPVTDAFYGDGKELWSRYLTGKQGKAPMPYYDPLTFAVDEAHKRGMELHAWFNPYRATMDLIQSHTDANHITRTKPEWFFVYDGQKLFNPGIPEVREYIIEVIMNVVRKYDIDAVHFDDYFYPYPEKGMTIRDQETFRTYGSEFETIADWRRHNVDTLIHTLSDSIHAEKKFMKFGISPFGIWRNLSQDPEGSESTGLDGYSQLYADARKWIKEGWVDYINPQIYFPFFYRAAPYEKLVDWWSNNSFGKHVYIGHGAYRAMEKREGWREKTQIPDQIRYLRNNTRVQGSVYFSSKSLRDNLAGLNDSLRNDFYKIPALQPVMLWLDGISPNAPRELRVLASDKQAQLTWQSPNKAKDGDVAYGYVIYRFNEGDHITIDNPKNILKISFDASECTFTDTDVLPDSRYTYVVTAIDRLKNESESSNLVGIKTPEIAEAK